jgi:hypothetical protein
MRLLKTYYKNFIPCFILLLVLQTNVQSQSSDNKFVSSNHWFIGFGGGPAQTNISNYLTAVLSGVDVNKKNSYSLSVDAGYFFSKYFGLSVGIGMSPFLTQLSLDSYSNSLDTVDSENESYERRISGQNIKENQKIYFLEIPLMLNFQYPFGKVIGFYVQGGVNLAIPVNKTYSSSGTYTYTGYYPAYNVLLKDLPYEGFKSNVETDISGELKIKTINPELVAAGGFYFRTEKKFQISVGFFYKKMLSDISDYSPVTSFQLSTHENQARSFMEGSEKATASSIGIIISMRYYLK